MGENEISDEGMKIICASMGQVRKLFLNHNLITDAGMTDIRNLKFLKCLDIRCNRITDQSLENIGKVVSLSQLSLSNNQLTDSGIKHLLSLK